MYNKCILCHSITTKIYHTKFGKYYHCDHCDFIYKDNKLHLSPKEEKNLYDQHNNSIEDPRYVEFFYKFLNDAVFPFTGKGKEALDFGSGPSPVLAQLLSRNHKYNMDIYDLFYSPEKVYLGKKYDLVTSTEVIEHLQNPIEYFDLFANLLKPNGILSIMTLFHPNSETEFMNWHYIRDMSHTSFYTLKTIKYIAEQTGLKIIYSDNIRYTTLVLDKK